MSESKISTRGSALVTPKSSDEDVSEKKKKRGCCKTIIGKIWNLEEDKVSEHHDQEAFVKQTFKELVIYLVFLIFICIIAFTMASTNMYYYTKVMMDLFLEEGKKPEDIAFKKIKTMGDFWNFATGTLMGALFWDEWYNSKRPPPIDGLIYYENKLLGPPRLRQMRVSKDSCEIVPTFQGVAGIAPCYAAYTDETRDTKPYTWPDRVAKLTAADPSHDAWKYRSAAALKDDSIWGYWGKLMTYDKDGYAIDLNSDKDKTADIIKTLKDDLWLRRGSRAVFISFTVYNANINLFCVITLCVEFPATGGAVPSWTFDTVKLIRYVTQSDYFIMICEIIFMVFICYYTIEEVVEIKAHGFKAHLKELWNLLDMLIIAIAFLCCALNIYREYRVSTHMATYIADDGKFKNFENLGFFEARFNNCVALLVFFSWVKVFKYISFNKTMTQLSTTLNRCAFDLAGFLIMFIIVFAAFTQLGFLLFKSQIEDFHTFINSFFTLFRIILGDFNFAQLREAKPILGPIFFMMFVFFVFFVLINMFLAIINDTYSEVKSDMAKQVDVFIMSDYVKQSINRFMDKLVSTKERMEGIEKFLQFESKNQRLGYEDWKSELLKKGYEETEIDKVFRKYDVDGDRTLDPSEQKQMLEDLEKQKGILKTSDKKREETMTPFGEYNADGESDEDVMEEVETVAKDEFTSMGRRVEKLEVQLHNILHNLEHLKKTFNKHK